MDRMPFSRLTTRREMLRATGAVAGGVLLARYLPGKLLAGAARPMANPQQAGAAPVDPVAATRAQMGATPLETVKLSDNLAMLSGPGGNVVVLNGPDGKVVVDSFVQTVWAKLKQSLDGMGNAPIRVLIDTHWHFDHTDNNSNFRAAGAQILAHENTKKRLSEPHDLLGMHFAPSPASALPTQTFTTATHRLQVNGENLLLGYIPPAHTDTDIYIQYPRANVIHLGDTFFNGMYPFIDAGTGGNINGMIAAANRSLAMVDSSTKIVPGHGPMGDRAALTRYRDVLVTVRDRVQIEKSAGKKVEEVVAAKPTAEFDAAWGMGFMQPDVFVAIVYNTL